MNDFSENKEEEDSLLNFYFEEAQKKKVKTDDYTCQLPFPNKGVSQMEATPFFPNLLWDQNKRNLMSEESRDLNLKSESEKSLGQNKSSEIREKRKLFKIIHKIRESQSCQNLETFVRKYYLSKKQSFITVLRKKIEELYNFNNEFLLPLSLNCINNIYDSESLTIRLRKPSTYSTFALFREEKAEDLEIVLEPYEWKRKLIHGIEKMMLAQSFSENYMKRKALSYYSIGLQYDYDLTISRNKNSEIESMEETSQIICSYRNFENDLEIYIDISLGNLIPQLQKPPAELNFTRIKLLPELKFEDIDTILVTHKKLDYMINTNLKINVSGHGCLHEIKSVRNFLTKLDKESVYKHGKKPYAFQEFICDEEKWGKEKESLSSASKKLNKITKFQIVQYSKLSLEKTLRLQYYLELEVRNFKSDYKLVIGLLKVASCLENIHLIKFNVKIMESQFGEFISFLDSHKQIWLKNKYLIDMRINDYCEPLIQNSRSLLRNMINRRRIAFLQSVVIENLRKTKKLKFRPEICQEIMNYLV